MTTIDARGKACPMPVILAKKELDAGAGQLAVVVDNQTAVENLRRLGESLGYGVSVSGQGDALQVLFTRSGAESALPVEKPALPSLPCAGDWVLFVGSEGIGRGSPELGSNLMAMLFYTLSQGENLPASILFMNGGVRLPSQNEQVVGHLIALQQRGCEILVCGTCLNYYGLTEQLKIGTVSNMYDISSRLLAATKVISF